MDRHFPTLNLIDQARGDSEGAFGSAANAEALERRARVLASEYWSERVWLTGAVSGHAFDRVVAELQALRVESAETPVVVSIASDLPLQVPAA